MNTQVERLVARYEADITDVRAKLAELQRLHDNMQRRTEQAGQRSQQQAQGALLALNNIRSRAMLVAGSITGLFGAATSSMFVALGNEAMQLENQMRGFGVATDEARRKVYEMAMETRTPIQATVGLLRSMSNALKDQDFETTLRQVGTLNRLLTIGGLDAGQRGSVVLQFGQALQSGTLSGDELRALREAAPYELLEGIAKAAGSTVDQLRKLGAEGKLTSDIMVQALNNLEQVSKDKFGDFNMTIGDAMNVMRTGMLAAAGEIERSWGLAGGIAGTIAAVGRTFQDNTEAFATFAEAVKLVGQVALVAAGSRGLMAIVPAMAAVRASSLTAAIAVAQLQRGLGGLLTMLGGPWGLALFAAGTAALLLARRMKDTEDRLDAARDATGEFIESQRRLEELAGDRRTAIDALREAEENLQRAIADQGAEAAATARLEVEGARDRVEAIESLIAIEQRLAEQRRQNAQEEIDEAQQSMAAISRAGLSSAYLETGDTSYLEALRSADPSTLIQAYERYLVGLETLTGRQERHLELLRALRQQEADTNEALAAQDEEAFTAHIAAWNRYLDDLEKQMGDAVAKVTERRAKIAELEQQRAAIPALIEAGRISRQDGMLGIRRIDEEIEKLSNVEDRLTGLRAELQALQSSASGALQFDESGEGARQLRVMDMLLKSAEMRIEDVDNAELDNLEAAMQTILERVQEILGGLREVPEALRSIGTGFELNLGRFQPYQAGMAMAGDARNAVEYLKRREGFISVPKWDMNALRVGYGTDTVFDAQGNPQRVTASTRVTEEQASYALSRRLQDEFIPAIIRAVGQVRWDAMSDQQRTALTSLSYNYGAHSWGDPRRLGPVADAVRSGSEQAVANAIAALASHNDGINRERRMEESAMWGQPSDTARAELQRIEDAERQRQQEADDRARRQKAYLEGLQDENERIELQAQLLGKSAHEQERILRTHELVRAAQEAGYDLNDPSPLDQRLSIQQQIAEQVERELQAKYAIATQEELNNQQLEENRRREEEHAQRMAEINDYRRSIEQDIQNIIIGSIMKTRDWRDAAAALLEKLAEALLTAGLFGQGPGMSGSGGMLGGFVSGATNWLMGLFGFAEGGIMTQHGPVPLNRYAYGGVANRPQLALFGEGSQPEAYVPLPDGRTIPVTLRMPDVPTPGVAGGGLMRMVVELDSEMLHARIVESSAPVAAAITESGLDRYNTNRLPSRIREVNSDPKRI